METIQVEGNLVDLHRGSVYAACLTIMQGRIAEIKKLNHSSGPYIIPGFIDSHIHIESSMLPPAEFARLAVVHGTVATVSDPHEIANVLGIEGVEYMIDNSAKVNFKCFFGAPSCVPATPYETTGATIGIEALEYLLAKPEINYLSEMMNWPGVIHREPAVMEKIALAHRYGKPVDGHAPGLRGEAARKYADAGITTDHECFSLEEALEKLSLGMHIIIREGSAARNFEALIPLLPEYCDQIMFGSDDLHPDNLVKGHINLLVQRAVARGLDPLMVLKVACVNPVNHYKLNVGLLRPGEPADLALVNDLESFQVNQVFVDGKKVAQAGKPLISPVASATPNKFSTPLKKPSDLLVKAKGERIRSIIAENGQLITGIEMFPAKVSQGVVGSDLQQDLLKIVVINRYADAPPAIGFIKNFGLKRGAIASSVAHDSHNIIAVGTDDTSICNAINEIITHKGGISAVADDITKIVPLPIAGLMSDRDGYQVARDYTAIDALAKSLGCQLEAPFMTLSFMALLVIPQLKLSDQGLFDGNSFRFVPLFE